MPCPERAGAGHREHQHGAEGEDVAGGGDLVGHELLGGDETGRADDHAGLGELGGLGRPRDPEVDHARAVRRQQHVRRLEVAVHHTRRVHALQRLRQRGAQREHRSLRPGAVRGRRRLQGDPGHVLGGQPRRPPLGVGVDHGGCEEAAHLAGRLDLPDEPAPEPRILHQFGAHRLHGDRAPAR
ncbi:hypothetical protein LUX39_49110 [Actinomadura madurae]|nr:hypothetical protein [Actinomadura madurae]MCQ0020638.1 hypothetical protein [Actinomadura madurae]